MANKEKETWPVPTGPEVKSLVKYFESSRQYWDDRYEVCESTLNHYKCIVVSVEAHA